MPTQPVCFLENKKIVAYRKAYSASQHSCFIQCLMTPTAFVLIHCTVSKKLPRQFQVWFRHVFKCPILLNISCNLMTNTSQQLQCHSCSSLSVTYGTWENETIETIRQGVDEKQERQHKRPTHSSAFIQMPKACSLASCSRAETVIMLIYRSLCSSFSALWIEAFHHLSGSESLLRKKKLS